MKIYCASPWFNPFEAIIKKKMKSKFNSEDVFDPQETEASRSYDKSPGKKLAEVIYAENIKNIEDCDTLVFWSPDNSDLGTMMEIGVAIKLGKKILRYDYLKDEIIEVEVPDYSHLEFKEDTFVRVDSVSDAIILGYNYDSKYKFFYELVNGKDNIMLSILGTRVQRVGNDYILASLDYKEIA